MKGKTIYILLLITLIVIAFSCKKNEILSPNNPEILEYLHIAHTRTIANPNMDKIIESIDYKKFDMLWLGGDLANSTSQDDETMSHVDSIFNLGDPNTLWALGNHDDSNLARIQAYTNRLPYFSYNKNGITFIVLNTQDSLISNIIGEQKSFFESIVDTIQESSHLIVLHHQLIWMYGNSELEPQISSVSNVDMGTCSYCINPNNFYEDIYPKLLEVMQRGIEVICIGGDIGINSKEFEYLTAEGIHFLASGIVSGDSDNKGLLFYHDVTRKQLSWEYILISDL